MFKVYKKEVEVAGKKISLETGKVARQADGAIIATCGETVVLATVVGAKKVNPDMDYFPLSVNYQEKYYAAGKIPGGYFKREARPTESETLISRLIDRPIRPLFPDEFKNEVQLLPTVISYDKENEADILSIIASSAALAISGMPFMGPVGASRVGYIDGKYVLNPSKTELEKSKLDLVVAGTKDAVLMVESEASGLTEEEMLNAVKFGHEGFVPVITMIEELAKEYPWAENLRIYNKLLKIKSTYVDRFRDRNEDGRYYFYFKQNGTVSGRYGSDAQQLPKPLEEGEDAPIIVKYVNIVRAFLTAGKGRKVIDADYESLEPHCFASVTGDKKLQEIFANGLDFYSYVAIQTEELKGVSADKKADNYLKKLDPVKRNKAKAYSLGVAYGMEAYALKMTLGVDQKTAEGLIAGYLDGFPELAKWRENSRKQVKEHGFIKNYVGRIRHVPKVK